MITNGESPRDIGHNQEEPDRVETTSINESSESPDSDDELGSTSQGRSSDEETAVTPNDASEEQAPAREHSYLPGTSHPLFPETLLDRRRRMRSSSFARLSVEGTIKRIRNESPDHSDGRPAQVEAEDASRAGCYRDQEGWPCHRSTDNVMELPILELNGVVLFPGSTIPIRLRHRHWVEYLGRQIDAARGIRGITPGAEEVRLGILTYADPRPARLQHRHSQRRRWMRRAVNVRRGSQMVLFLREYSQLLADSSEGSESETENDTGRQSDANNETSTTTRRTSNRNNRRQQAPSGGHDRRQPSQQPVDPLIGRIGTMATIVTTHEDAAGAVADAHQEHHSQYSRVWQRSEDGQLVITALGTGRFRIVSCVDANDEDGSLRLRDRGFAGDMADVKLYRVEELMDDEMPLPPVSQRRKFSSCRGARHEGAVSFLQHHEQTMHNMSLVSPVPYFVYHGAWPWRLVGLIREALDRIPGMEGLRRVLPRLPGSEGSGDAHERASSSLLEPNRFSFWMASNMPFSEREKLDLLEMNCLVQRLKTILNKVLDQEQRETFVYCKSCHQRLSQTSSIFTVGGAEGTTGAYVNEHGIVHQTVTLRQVQEEHIMCSGGPETKDSWFPGYSWTIAYCSLCLSHLGWKFLRVKSNTESKRSTDNQNNSQAEKDCPDKFWGMSGASITTQTSSVSDEQ